VSSRFEGAAAMTSVVNGKELVQRLESDWFDRLEPFFTPMNSQGE
jgi:hypothetical protein